MRLTRQSIRRRWFVPLLLSVASCAHLESTQAAPQTDSSGADQTGIASTAGSGSQYGPIGQGMASYTWHDGEREYRLWMDPTVIAEVGNAATARQALPNARLLADRQVGAQPLRYWRAETGVNSGQLLASLSREKAGGRFSPVLRETPSTDGPIRLLSGNIVVVLDPAWSKDAVSQWVARKQLRVLAELPFGPNMLLIETEAGLPALELANSLYQSGEAKAAFPDWLSEKSLK